MMYPEEYFDSEMILQAGASQHSPELSEHRRPVGCRALGKESGQEGRRKEKRNRDQKKSGKINKIERTRRFPIIPWEQRTLISA
jgi:hypothetical protein